MAGIQDKEILPVDDVMAFVDGVLDKIQGVRDRLNPWRDPMMIIPDKIRDIKSELDVYI